MQRFFARAVIAVVVAVLGFTSIGLPEAGAANTHSPLFAGYLGTKSAGFTHASARLTIPTFTCPALGSQTNFVRVQWSGVGSGFSALVQVELKVECNDGALNLSGSVTEFDPSGSGSRSFSVSEGDVVGADFSYNATSGAIWIVVRNVTTGDTVAEGARAQGLKWIGANAAVQLLNTPIPAFGAIRFAAMTIDGVAFGSAFNSLTGSDLYSDTTRLIRTTALNPAGTGFRLVFVNGG